MQEIHDIMLSVEVLECKFVCNIVTAGFGANYWLTIFIYQRAFQQCCETDKIRANIHVPSTVIKIICTISQTRSLSNRIPKIIPQQFRPGQEVPDQQHSRDLSHACNLEPVEFVIPVNAISAELYAGAGQDWVTRGSCPQRWISLAPAHPAQVHLTILKQLFRTRIRILQIDHSICDVSVPISYFNIYIEGKIDESMKKPERGYV